MHPVQTEEPRYEAFPPPPPSPKKSWWDNVKAFTPLVVIGAFLLGKLKVLAAIGKFILPAIKFLKLGKILTTGLSMIVSIWFYALMFGWSFAAGFVVCILVHEMGHVFVAWRQGIPVSAPLFIPGFGALIIKKEAAKTAWAEAMIGIGGPIGGAIAAVACWGIYSWTGNLLWLALAFTAFFMNLFNMMPIMPLDGGWITGAVSPMLWILGLAGMIYMIATGMMDNPFVWLLIIMSLPRLWMYIRYRQVAPPGVEPATKDQRIKMGLAYVGLAGFLAYGMSATHFEPPQVRKMDVFRDLESTHHDRIESRPVFADPSDE